MTITPGDGMLRPMQRMLVLLLALAACDKSSPASTPPTDANTHDAGDPLADATAVPNTEAQTGDVTVCPYSGRRFRVADDSPRWAYEGKTYVFCSAKALAEVQKDPAKYLATP